MGGAGAAAALSVPALLKAAPADVSPDVIIIGAGIFGAWTARRLQEMGRRVTLVDAWAPAHARASSGGESRMTRGAYGPDEVYTRMAWDSLADWTALSATAALPLFLETGAHVFFSRPAPYFSDYIGRESSGVKGWV